MEYIKISDLIIVDQPTVNGRIYSREICEEIKNQILKSIANNSSVIVDISKEEIDYKILNGGLDEVPLNRVIGTITNIELTDRFIFTIKRFDFVKLDLSDERIKPMMIIMANINELADKRYVVDAQYSYSTIIWENKKTLTN